jgi:predicted oxidoreductase
MFWDNAISVYNFPLDTGLNLWDSAEWNSKDEELDENSFCMLLLVRKKGDKWLRKWREFVLPLEVHRVESWAGLRDLRFHPVTSWSRCKQTGQDFATYKYHEVDDKGM